MKNHIQDKVKEVLEKSTDYHIGREGADEPYINETWFEDELTKALTDIAKKAKEEVLREVIDMKYRPHDSGYEFILASRVEKLLSTLTKEQ